MRFPQYLILAVAGALYYNSQPSSKGSIILLESKQKPSFLQHLSASKFYDSLKESVTWLQENSDKNFSDFVRNPDSQPSIQLLSESSLFSIPKEQTFKQILNNQETLEALKKYVYQHLPEEETKRKLQSLCIDDLIEQVIAGGTANSQDTRDCLTSFGDIDNAILYFQDLLQQSPNDKNIKTYCSSLFNDIQDNLLLWQALSVSPEVLTNFISALHNITSPDTSQTTTATGTTTTFTPPAESTTTVSSTDSGSTTYTTTTSTGTTTTVTVDHNTQTTTITLLDGTTITPPTTSTSIKYGDDGTITTTHTDGSTTSINPTTKQITTTSTPAESTTVSTTYTFTLGKTVIFSTTGAPYELTTTTTTTSTTSETPSTNETSSTTHTVTLSPLSTTPSEQTQKFTVTETTTDGITTYKIRNTTTAAGGEAEVKLPQPLPNGDGNAASSKEGAIAGGVTGGAVFLATVAAAVAVAIYLKNRQPQPVAEQGGQGEIIGAQSRDLEKGEDRQGTPASQTMHSSVFAVSPSPSNESSVHI